MPTESFRAKQSGAPSESGNDIFARAWQQFESQFPTEDDCWRELYRRLEGNGQVKCCHCGGKDLDENSKARVRRCRKCNKKTWLTAGTFFNRMRFARPWLAAIWLMEQGLVISSLKLHKLVGIAQSSALHILKKLAIVIESHFEDDAASMSSGLFCRVFCKRSRLTPAREHPVKEQEEMEKNWQMNADLILETRRTNLFTSIPGQRTDMDVDSLIGAHTRVSMIENNLAGQEKEIYDVLSEEPILFDDLCKATGMSVSDISATLTLLEIAGATERLPGDRYVRFISNKSVSKPFAGSRLQSKMAVSDFINFVCAGFHGISRKYVQLYLALYWCHMARTRWCNGSLLQACLQFGRISHDQILAYVSPLIVKSSLEQT